ncbi:MAG TPA: S9 family peptidase [Steroidobacteraceae bacterium]|nr:S9 family peptidase [Steroidobacteraceae bacterium]
MRTRILIWAACLVPFGVLARPLTPDDVYRWIDVTEPRISPDGNWIAYTLSVPNRATDSDGSEIWLVSWDGKQNRRLTPPAAFARDARWSPDGRLIGYLGTAASESGDEQIWVAKRDGGAPQRVTRFEGSISEFGWSPDGKRLVFSARPSSGAKDADKPAPIVIDRLQFQLDNEGYLTGERSHLYVIDAAGGAVTQLTNGSADDIQPAWSPAGSEIVFLSKAGPEPDAHDNWDLYRIEPQARSKPRQLTRTPEMENDPVWGRGFGPPRFSADGKRLAYVRLGKPEDSWFSITAVAASGVDGSAAILPTTALDRLTLNPHWSADARSIYFMLEDDRSVELARVRLDGGRVERLTAPDRVVADFDVSASGRIAVLCGTSDRPSELMAFESGKLRPLTHHNESWLGEVAFARSRNVEFKSHDGTPVHGLLMIPAGGRPPAGWPTIVRVDGGPAYQWQHEFDLEWQLLVAHGYAVIGPNPRGSSGRGYAYQRAILGNWGFVDAPDILAAADFAVAQGIADRERLGIGGWSYGAQLTNFVIASDSRFKAATSGAGISNMLAGYGVDQYVREWENELGLPWMNTDTWLRLSHAFLHADRIRTPTLFLSGSEDSNVPLVGSKQMYQALRRLGVATELVIYPGEYHGLARPSFRVDRAQRYDAWYDRFLRAN